MRKIALVLVVLAVAAVGQKVWVSTAAQTSGPFAEFSINPTNQAQIEQGLDRLRGRVSKFTSENELTNYFTGLKFECTELKKESKELISRNTWIAYNFYVNCRYPYGFFGDLIVSRIYLDKQRNILYISIRNVPFEV